MNHCSDEDENSTHTLTNETLNDGGSDGSPGQRKHKMATQNSNEVLSSPLSSCEDGKCDSTTSSSPAKDDDDTVVVQRKNCPRIKNSSVSVPTTPADTPLPIRRKKNLTRNRSNQSQTPTITSEKESTENSKEKNTKRKQSTSSGSGAEDTRDESKSLELSKTKKKRNTLIGVREISTEFERDTDSSIASSSNRRSFVKRRLDALRNLSVSNVTITNVSYHHLPNYRFVLLPLYILNFFFPLVFRIFLDFILFLALLIRHHHPHRAF